MPRGGTWNRDDVILFSPQPNIPPSFVSAAGGDATPAPTAGPGLHLRYFPTFLPDGRHYLFLAIDPAQNGFAIGVASLDSVDTKELVQSRTSGLYAPPGYLLFRRDTALVAQSFDGRTLQLGGTPVPIGESVSFHPLTYQALFSVSDTAVLAYEGSKPASELVWFNRQEKRLAAAAPAGDYNTFCLTSDEKRVVYDLADPVSGSVDLWAFDLASGGPSRLTFDPAVDFFPVCSPTGQEVIFASLREGAPNLFRQLITAPGSEKAVLRSPLPKVPTDWSRDGRLLVHSVLNPKTSWDIEVMPLSGGQSVAFAATAADERNAKLSADDRWMAYVSNETGSFEVYVQPFPATGAKWQVSKGGGLQPQWERDGRRLYYIALDKKLIDVEVRAGQSDFALGEARALVETRMTGSERISVGSQYAVKADGGRFLVNTATDTTLPITLVLNWTPALKK